MEKHELFEQNEIRSVRQIARDTERRFTRIDYFCTISRRFRQQRVHAREAAHPSNWQLASLTSLFQLIHGFYRLCDPSGQFRHRSKPFLSFLIHWG